MTAKLASLNRKLASTLPRDLVLELEAIIKAINDINISGIGTAGVSTIIGTDNQINTSASTGDITLSLPQDINASASPTFVSVTLNGLTANHLVYVDAAKKLSAAQLAGWVSAISGEMQVVTTTNGAIRLEMSDSYLATHILDDTGLVSITDNGDGTIQPDSIDLYIRTLGMSRSH